ncbi:nucleotidyltransferase domain-containing protein [Muricomes intestini]|uniref:nucleotidyltransferase domain-containing protein n=1 Tax=Muricomes intestini TaxID=1796634 RepID=UPI002FDFE534
MPYTTRKEIYNFISMVGELLGDKLDKIILYGSFARGDDQENSDVDIMILVRISEQEIKKIENYIYDIAFDIELNTGVDISPVIKNVNQFEYWEDTLPFYRNVKEEGVVIDG